MVMLPTDLSRIKRRLSATIYGASWKRKTSNGVDLIPLKRRMAIFLSWGRATKEELTHEFARQGNSERTIADVVQAMLSRGEMLETNQGGQIYLSIVKKEPFSPLRAVLRLSLLGITTLGVLYGVLANIPPLFVFAISFAALEVALIAKT